MNLNAIPTLRDLETLPQRERHYAALLLAAQAGTGAVSLSRVQGELHVTIGQHTYSLDEWYLRSVVRSAVLQAMRGGVR